MNQFLSESCSTRYFNQSMWSVQRPNCIFKVAHRLCKYFIKSKTSTRSKHDQEIGYSWSCGMNEVKILVQNLKKVRFFLTCYVQIIQSTSQALAVSGIPFMFKDTWIFSMFKNFRSYCKLLVNLVQISIY